MASSVDRYSRTSRVLHWLIASLIVLAVWLGLQAIAYDRGHPTRDLLLALHRPLGVTILLLSLIRVAWAYHRPPPHLPPEIAAVERFLARIVHIAFWLLLILMPLSGLLLTQAAGREVSFGFFSLPQIVPVDPSVPIPERPLVQLGLLLHKQIFPPALYVLVGLHLLGVAKHLAFDRRAQVWQRIWG
jgi:cytochrome b561